MRPKILAFWQHVQGILATMGYSCNDLGHFHNILLPQCNLVLSLYTFPSTTSTLFIYNDDDDDNNNSNDDNNNNNNNNNVNVKI